jgi:hypothetical protein
MSELNFNPPSENENFKYYWNLFLPDIRERENLKPSHLQQLKVLCDLSVEYDTISEILILQGMTYESVGRNGMQIKLRPEVQQKNRVVSEIRNYSKMLGLILVKDTKFNDEGEKNEFD